MGAATLIHVGDEEIQDLPEGCVQIQGLANAKRFVEWFELMAKTLHYMKPDIVEKENNRPDTKLVQKLFEQGETPWGAAEKYLQMKYPSTASKESFMVEEPSTMQ